MCVIITEWCNVTVNSMELIGTIEYVMLETRCFLNGYHKQVGLYIAMVWVDQSV